MALDKKLKIEPPTGSKKQNQGQLLWSRSAADASNLTVPSMTSKEIGKGPVIGDSQTRIGPSGSSKVWL